MAEKLRDKPVLGEAFPVMSSEPEGRGCRLPSALKIKE